MEEDFKNRCREEIVKLDTEANEARERLKKDKVKLATLTGQKEGLLRILGEGRFIPKPKKKKEEVKNEVEQRV